MSIYCPLSETLQIESSISILDIVIEDFELEMLSNFPFFKKGSKQTEEWINNKAASRSREWKVQHPDGTIEVIKNLKKFCLDKNISYKNMHRLKNKTSRNRTVCQGYKLLGKVS